MKDLKDLSQGKRPAGWILNTINTLYDGDLDVAVNMNSPANSREIPHKMNYYLTHIWIFELGFLTIKMLKHKNMLKSLPIFHASQCE